MERLEGGLRAKGLLKKGNPMASVITVCLNAADRLEKTIKSVIGQDYPHIEYIIIDGGSDDGTLDVIQRYEDYIAYWMSEKDDGISDAFNKGFRSSTGDWIAFLNAGDAYYGGRAVSGLMEYAGRFDIIYGSLKGARKKDGAPHYYYAEDVSGDLYWLTNAIPHQSCIVSREVFKKIGLFETKMKFAMDYEHFLRAYKKGFRFKAVKQTVTEVTRDGVSAVFWREQLKELWLAQKMHKILPLLRFFYYCERFLRTYMYCRLGYF